MGKISKVWGIVLLLISNYTILANGPHQITANHLWNSNEKKDTAMQVVDKQKLVQALKTLSSTIINPFFSDTLNVAMLPKASISFNSTAKYFSAKGRDTIPTPVYSGSDIQEDTLKDDIEVIESSLDSIDGLYKIKPNASVIAAEVAKFEQIPDSIFIKRLSKLPMLMHLPYNEKVRDYIKLYTAKKKRQLGVMIGMSEYYFPIFEKVLDQQNIPIELKYLAVIESALNPIARSRAGAVGLWQFMIGTGKMYKLEANSFVDERRDPIKATHAAATYLKDLFNIYQDWTLVIAAYNCGPGNVNKAIRRAGGKKDYWAIYNYLPRETRGYVPCFIAATYAFNYYKDHNVVPVKVNNNFEADTLMLNKKLHLNQVAEVLNVPIELVRYLNPQYKKDIIPAHEEKSYSLCLPSDVALRFIDLQDSIYKTKCRTYYDDRQIVDIPSKNGRPISADMTKLTYTVKSGDNLGLIASLYDVTVADLKIWNSVGRRLSTGKKINIYVPNSSVDKYRGYSSAIASVSDEKPKIENAPSMNTVQAYTQPTTKSVETGVITNVVAASNGFVYYVLQPGDNLWTVAKKYPGVTNTDIMKLNNFTNQSVKKLKPGQAIKVMKKN